MKKWLLSLMTVGVCLQSGCIFFGDDDTKDPPTTNNSNNTKNDMSSDMAGDMMDMSGDMPVDVAPDIPKPDMKMCDDLQLPPDSLCCEGIAEPVSIGSDPNNCGGCGIACNAGETCDGGKCTCENGASPIVVARDISAESIVTVLPFLGQDRIKPCDDECQKNAMGFEDLFKGDPSLLHYAVLHRKPNDININLIGLDAYGNTIDDATSRFSLFTQSSRTIQDVEYWIGLDSITMFVHFRQATKPRSELRLYSLVRGIDNKFKLDNPNGVPFGGENDDGIVDDVLAMGTLASNNQFAVAAIVKDDADTVLVGGITIGQDNGAKEYDLPLVTLTTAQTPQVGTKLNVAYDEQSHQAIVTWWSPSLPIMPGARNGRFYAMIYGVGADGLSKVTDEPIWLNDVQASDDRKDIPYSVALGVNRTTRQWQLFQLKKQASATNVQVVSVNPNSSPNRPAATGAMSIENPAPAVAFSPSADIHYNRGVVYREFTWVSNAVEATRGAISFAPVLGAMVEAKPLSAGKDYLSVAQGFGLPGTMGYVGLYHPVNAGDQAAEVHFFMTQRGQLVCEPGAPETPLNP